MNATIKKLAATARIGLDLLETLAFPGKPYSFDVWGYFGDNIRVQFEDGADALLCYAYALDKATLRQHCPGDGQAIYVTVEGTWSGIHFHVTGTFDHDDDRAVLAAAGDAISLHTLRRIQIQQTARGAR